MQGRTFWTQSFMAPALMVQRPKCYFGGILSSFLFILSFTVRPNPLDLGRFQWSTAGEVARELMKGISVSLGLEEGYIEKAMNLDSGLQFVAANLYPPCPKPDVAIGLPPHSDYGLLTLLIHNGVCGLQVQHKGNWVNLNPNPNAFVVNIGNHMEILSKGKYKSVFHRALVNETDARMSILVVHGPALETVVSPAPELVDNETNPPAFAGMKYREYLEMLQSKIHARLSPK
ncbi:hypothetical protein I3760_11G088000 [Carya illinoinensis]|nr:hypothetical protein I3760_11G088000 [Carya illinoinensis]